MNYKQNKIMNIQNNSFVNEHNWIYCYKVEDVIEVDTSK